MPGRREKYVSSEDRGRQLARRAGRRLALIYAVAAGGWILFSDYGLFSLGLPSRLEAQLGSVKGLFFVLVTAVLLYGLASRYLNRIHSSEERYRRLFDNASEGLTLFRVLNGSSARPRLRLEDMNATQARRLLLPRQDLIGLDAKRAVADYPDLDEYLRLVERAVETGESVRSEISLQERGLTELASAYPVQHDLWVLASMDVTAQREAQAALVTQDKRIRQAYVDVLDAVTGGRLVLLTEEELVERLGDPISPLMSINSPEQLAEARRRVSEALRASFGDAAEQVDFRHPLSEALNNVLKHAGHGEYQVFRRDDHAQVMITDCGPGIDFKNLPKATLQPGYSTTATLGMGFTIMLQLVERVFLVTESGLTTVVLDSSLRPPGAAEQPGRISDQDAVVSL